MRLIEKEKKKKKTKNNRHSQQMALIWKDLDIDFRYPHRKC